MVIMAGKRRVEISASKSDVVDTEEADGEGLSRYLGKEVRKLPEMANGPFVEGKAVRRGRRRLTKQDAFPSGVDKT